MSTDSTWRRWRTVGLIVTAVAGLSILVAACGDDDGDDGGGGGGDGDTLACGLGNGEPASGEPIKLGGIATKQPGSRSRRPIRTSPRSGRSRSRTRP